MGRAHIVRDVARDLNLHKFALSDSRAPLAGFSPVLFVVHQFRPEGKRSALERFCLVDRAPAIFQELALSMSRDAETTHIPGAVNVAPLERLSRHIEESGETPGVFFGKIDEPLLLTTVRAAGLALEAQ